MIPKYAQVPFICAVQPSGRIKLAISFGTPIFFGATSMDTGRAAEDVQVLNAMSQGSNAFFQNVMGLTFPMRLRSSPYPTTLMIMLAR